MFALRNHTMYSKRSNLKRARNSCKVIENQSVETNNDDRDTKS